MIFGMLLVASAMAVSVMATQVWDDHTAFTMYRSAILLALGGIAVCAVFAI